ncbi:uncharacterized protein LOC111605839 isoform X1 [Xiphophorus maculatus]|uniref:uncharacterized protein LOC111605839 isoform X1 n=1 Tax=Xiphophorus maculatus TaxID=8083 RepID=UPI000C6E1BDA|nr:uncharacterized protein LOC111605839 isoform X1 [Xiphophorus maculatus]
MYKSYQPFHPVANHLQQKWQSRRYSNHLDKVQFAHPVVDTRRRRKSANSQCKMKRLQDRRLSAARRDNCLLASRMRDDRLLASRMANIKSTVNDRNEYYFKSMNTRKRKQDLMVISEENQAMYQRILSRKSVYCREHFLGDWMKTKILRQHLSRYPREQATQQRLERKEKMVTFDKQDQSSSKSTTGRTKEIPRDHLNAGKRKQDIVAIGGQNKAMYQRLTPQKSVFSRELWLGEWKKTEILRQHLSRYPREQATKQRLERKEKMVTFDKKDQSSSKSTTGRTKEIPRDHLIAGKRKQDLVVVGWQNQAMYRRRPTYKSEFSREQLLRDWKKKQLLRQHLSRYTREQATKQRLERKEKMVTFDKKDQSSSKSTTGRSKEIPRDHLNAGKRKQDLVFIGGQNQAMYRRRPPYKSEFSREHWLPEWKKTELLRQHLSRYAREQATKQRLERKEKMVTFDKKDQSSSKSTTGRSKGISSDQ